MAQHDVFPETSLRLERTLAAPREKVFAAWTSAETLIRWFAPTEAYTCDVHALDARVGGEYRIEMRHTGGNRHVVTGTYREIVPPSRLVFTWRWENIPERGDSRVTVELLEEGAGTRLVLTHERFPNTEARDAHRNGWTGGLDNLVRLFEA